MQVANVFLCRSASEPFWRLPQRARAFIAAGMAIGLYVGGLLEDRFSSLAPSYVVSAAVFVVAALAAVLVRDARGRHC